MRDDGWRTEMRAKPDIIMGVFEEKAHFIYFSIQDCHIT
jgi:hypothetical protein